MLISHTLQGECIVDDSTAPLSILLHACIRAGRRWGEEMRVILPATGQYEQDGAYQHEDAVVHFKVAQLGQAAQAAGSAQQAALHAQRGHAGGLEHLQAQDCRLHSSSVVQGQALQALQVLQRAQQPGGEL